LQRKRLKIHFRQSNTLVRVGAMACSSWDHIESRNNAQKAAESLLELPKSTLEIDGHSLRIIASIVMSIFPDGNESRPASAAAGRLPANASPWRATEPAADYLSPQGCYQRAIPVVAQIAHPNHLRGTAIRADGGLNGLE